MFSPWYDSSVSVCSDKAGRDQKLTRIYGHLILLRRGGIGDAENEGAVSGGILAADGRAGSVRTDTWRVGSRVRAIGPGDTKPRRVDVVSLLPSRAAPILSESPCLNHLLRRCKELQEDHPDSLWAGQEQVVLQTGLAVRDRCNDGELSEHGLASVRGRRIPVKPITRSGGKPITCSGANRSPVPTQTDHLSERSDAGRES